VPSEETIGARIRRLRLDQGYSIREFARLVKAAPSTIAGYERGAHEPPPGVLLRAMAHNLRVRPGYLLYGDDPE